MSSKFDYPVTFKVRALKKGSFHEIGGQADLLVSNNLNKEMMEQPARYAFYAGLAEEEYRRGKRIKYQLHCLEEDLDKSLRKKAETDGVRLTEAGLKLAIKRHSGMRSLYDRYVTTMRRAGHLKVLKDAFAQRKDMLQSIGANQRKEYETEVKTMMRKVQSKLSNKHKEDDDD